MLRLLSLFWDICRGHKTPQDLPYSIHLFWILVFFAIVLDVVNLQISYLTISPGWAILTIVSQTVIIYSSFALFLSLMGFSNRINQTINSILGCGLIIGVMATPLNLLIDETPKTLELPILLLWALNIWMLFIIAHILRHALSLRLPVAYVLSVGFFMLNILISNWFLSDFVSDTVSGTS
jgi:hypothetical protein